MKFEIGRYSLKVFPSILLLLLKHAQLLFVFFPKNNPTKHAQRLMRHPVYKRVN